MNPHAARRYRHRGAVAAAGPPAGAARPMAGVGRARWPVSAAPPGSAAGNGAGAVIAVPPAAVVYRVRAGRR